MSNIVDIDETPALKFIDLSPGDCFTSDVRADPGIYMKLAMSPPTAVDLVTGQIHPFDINDLCYPKKRVIIKHETYSPF